MDGDTTSRLPCNRDVTRVASEGCDILGYPLECDMLVMETDIATSEGEA